jgi:hypothetical protein
MNLAVAIYSAIVFFILSPGVLLRLPPNGGKMTVAAVHAVVFGVILYFTAGFVWRLSMSTHLFRREGLETKGPAQKEPSNTVASMLGM